MHAMVYQHQPSRSLFPFPQMHAQRWHTFSFPWIRQSKVLVAFPRSGPLLYPWLLVADSCYVRVYLPFIDQDEGCWPYILSDRLCVTQSLVFLAHYRASLHSTLSVIMPTASGTYQRRVPSLSSIRLWDLPYSWKPKIWHFNANYTLVSLVALILSIFVLYASYKLVFQVNFIFGSGIFFTATIDVMPTEPAPIKVEASGNLYENFTRCLQLTSTYEC